MINELPTVFDVVTGKKPLKDKPVVNNSAGNKAKSAGKVVRACSDLSKVLCSVLNIFHAPNFVLEEIQRSSHLYSICTTYVGMWVSLSFYSRDQLKFRQNLQSPPHLPLRMRRRLWKMTRRRNMAIPSVEVVEEITLLMSSG